MHSRHCSTRVDGVPGHMWLRGETARQNAVWQAIKSALTLGASSELSARKDSSGDEHMRDVKGYPRVVLRSSNSNAKQTGRAAQMIRGWFQDHSLQVKEVIDDSSEWNFEILVNGVLLHSRSSQWQGFFHDDWSQQSLVWRAISDLVPDEDIMAMQGA